MIPEYTYERAKKLYGLNIPKTELPMDLKIVWCDATNPGDIKNLLRVGSHRHTFFEIHFVLHGEVVYECEDKMMRVTSGNALFIASDTLHRYARKSDDLFKVALAFRIDEKSDIRNRIAAVDSGIFVFSSSVVENISFALKQVEENTILSPHIISGRFTEIINSVFCSLGVELPENCEERSDPRVVTAIEYIDRNKKCFISCEDVARECCLSSKQLNRIFQKSKQMSLYKYIIRERMRYAQKILLQNERSIKEISLMLGFEDESNFVSFFKRHCGISPGVYKQKHADGASSEIN